jgi:hypothetical protein
MQDQSLRISLALLALLMGGPLLAPRGARAETPAAAISATPAAGLDFGTVAVGAASGIKSLTLVAGGNALLTITDVSLTGPNADQFRIVSDTGGVGFSPGGQRILGLRFSPTSAGAKSAFLSVSSNAVGSPLNVLLTGTTPLEPAFGYNNLLVNGGFEEPDTTRSAFDYGYTYGVIPGYPSYRGCCIPGWSITAGTIDVVPKTWPPAEGKQSIDLVGSPGAATIEQSFPTQPGQDYVFSGYMSQNWDVTFARANIYLNGGLLTQLYHHLGNNRIEAHWQFFAYPFLATTTTTRLTISDVTGLSNVAGTALDGLAVTPASELAGLFSSASTLLINPPGGTLPGYGQVLLHVDECARLTFLLRTNTGIADMTYDPSTTFFADPPRDGFAPTNHSNRFCATVAEANSTFLIYGRYVDPSTGQAVQSSVMVVVRP